MLDLFKNIIRKSKDRNEGLLLINEDFENNLSEITPQWNQNALIIKELIDSNPCFESYYSELTFRYILSDKIGEGAFSTVYKAFDTIEKRDIAIKIIKKESMKKEQLEATRREIAIMRRIDHSHIIKLYNFQNTDDSKYCFIFMELVSGGELFNQIIRYTYFSEDLTRHIMRQVANTVKYLHDRGIVHRDIKPENLLFEPCEFFERSIDDQIGARRKSDDSNKVDEGSFVKGIGAGGIGIVKLADFGLSIDLGETGSNLAKTPCGTVGYTSPEQHLNIGYDKKVDVWALGCVLYTMVVGFPPFYSNTQDSQDISKKVAKGDYKFLKPWFDEVSVECKNLITNLLTVDPAKRYSIEQLLADPWMNIGYEECHIGNTNPAADAPGSHFDPALYEKFQESLINTNNIDDYFTGNKLATAESVVTPRAEAIKLVFNTATHAQRNKTPLLLSQSPSSGIVDTLFMSTITTKQRRKMESNSDLSELDSDEDDSEIDNNDAINQSQNNIVSGVFSNSDIESEDSELDEETDHFIQSMGTLKRFNSPRCKKSANIDSTTSSCITPVQSHATATTVTTAMTVGSTSPKNTSNSASFTIKNSIHSNHSKKSSRSTTIVPPESCDSMTSSLQSSPKMEESSDSRQSSIVTCEIHDYETGSRRKSSISFQIAPKKVTSSSSSVVSMKFQNIDISTSNDGSLKNGISEEEEDDTDNVNLEGFSDLQLNSPNTGEKSEEGDDTEHDFDITPTAYNRLSFGAGCQQPHKSCNKKMRKHVLTHTPYIPHTADDDVNTVTGLNEEEVEESLDQKFINRGLFDLKLSNSALLSRRKNKVLLE